MKEYKNTNDLIDFLIAKGVKVNDRSFTFNTIEKYSYYSIVNTYKSIFKDSNGNYVNNVTFEEIYALFEFDKELKLIFLKYILEIEYLIRTKVSETISLNYGIEDYLIEKNLDDNYYTKDVINKINDEINKQKDKHDAIKHYLKNYNSIPPYVLVKILSFGELSKLFGVLKQSDKQLISKSFKISDKILKETLTNISMVRNICAHNDRLYNFRSKFLISFKNIDRDYINIDNLTNIYMIMKSMELLLNDKFKNEFEILVNDKINDLRNKIISIDFDLILKAMGFPNINTIEENI